MRWPPVWAHALYYRAIESGRPVAIVALFRAGPAGPSGTINVVAQRLGLVVSLAQQGRV